MMSSSVTNHVAWLDGNSTSQQSLLDSTQLDWPLTTTGQYRKISEISTTGIIMVCKSLPGVAFIGPDKYTRIYRIKHRKYQPILPKLFLHIGPSHSSPVWATYEAITLRKARIEIPRPCESTVDGVIEVSRKSDGRRNKYVFTMMIEGRKETFGWRRSKNAMIKNLGLSHNGYKLARLTEGTHSSSYGTGPKTSDRMQVVALAGRSHHVVPRCMALRYLTSFGNEWEVVSLVTLLAFWLWDRKRMMRV
ncbi:hypothetical protein F5Y12DRAFT_558058 [Xylaria sp. FL1777]|nr:hypothetical protein F5Y12DRAFT_558058 [Xylaria sp. FL1777]